MDFEILPQLIIVFSAAGILLIIGKNFSKVKEASQKEDFLAQTSTTAEMEKKKFMYLYKRAVRRINKENYRKAIARFWVWLEKFLRKLRISFLKIDGKMVSFLENLRQKNVQSIEKLKETERNIRKNMEGESYARFWNAKKPYLNPKTSINADAKDTKENENSATGKIEETVAVKIAASSMPAAETRTKSIADEPSAAIASDENERKILEIYTEETVRFAVEDMVKTEHGEEVTLNNGRFVKKETEEAEKRKEPEEAREQQDEDNQGIRTHKEQEYIEMLMKNPADIKAYWKLGLIYSKRHNYDDALACFRQIVKIDPTYTKAKQKAIELMEKMKGKGK